MSRNRGIKTTISTVRSTYDLNGNYLPAGSYFFNVNKFERNKFIGNIDSRGNYGKFIFSPMDLIKMLAVGQSKLASEANLLHVEGMPNYPVPINNNCFDFYNTNSIVNYYHNNRVNFRNNVIVPTSYRNRVDVRNYSSDSEDEEEEQETCRICLDEFENNQRKILECGHSYHEHCLNEWRRENNTCPICRSEIKIRTSRYLYDRILRQRLNSRNRRILRK